VSGRYRFAETELDRAVDRALAEENARVLADPSAIAEAQADGDRYRLELEAAGILPTYVAPRDRPSHAAGCLVVSGRPCSCGSARKVASDV
jgi:hypothetical protein